MPIDRRPVALTEDEFLNTVRSRAETAFSTADANLQAERLEVLEHYSGDLPLPFHEGSSKYVDRSVWSETEAYTANLQEAFAAGNNIVSLAPVGPEDVELAKHSTAYVERVLWQLNDGFEIFGDVIKDGAMGRTGFAKAYWEKSEEPEYHEFDGPKDALDLILGDDEAGFELEEKPKTYAGPEGIMATATLIRMVDTSQVRVEPVPPEEISVIGRTRNIRRLPFIGQRTIKTLGELVAAGYDKNKVYSIGANAQALEFNEEAQRRHQDTLPDAFLGVKDAADVASTMVAVYESYTWIDKEGTGRQALWMVVHAGDVILHSQKVARHPFVAFNPLPMPHRFHGENFANSVIPMANVKTTMVRGAVDHIQATTNPRWLVQDGAIKTPRQLLENRLRGLVFVSSKGSVLDAVAPMPQGSLNPFLPQIIEQMDVAKEATTGTTRLAQGLDKNALSNQNAGAMVGDQINVSQTRTKVAARRFAIQFLKELVLLIYEIGIQNDREARMVEVGGKFVEMTPSKWRSRRNVIVNLTLGYGERDKAAEELLGFDKLMTSTPSRLYGEKQRFEVLKKVLETKGHKDIQNFLVDPSTLPEPTPDPKSEAEIAKIKVETQGMTVDQQIKQLKVQHEQQLEAAKFSYQQQLDAVTNRFKEADLARKARELDNRIDISVAETELAAATFAEADTEKKASAIISPNS